MADSLGLSLSAIVLGFGIIHILIGFSEDIVYGVILIAQGISR